MEEEKQRGKGNRIILMPSPFQGHITPLLQLSNILYSKGFSITIVHTVFNSPDPSSYPHFTFLPLHGALSETEASKVDAVHLTEVINVRCVQPFKECLTMLLSHDKVKEDGSVSCFIADAALYFTQGVCDEVGVPRIVLRTGGASSFLVFASFPLLREKGYFPVQGRFFFSYKFSIFCSCFYNVINVIQ
jgi:hypothetical protein